MQTTRVSVVVPTLASDGMLLECLAALGRQTFRDFEAIVVDNSGENRVRKLGVSEPWIRVIAQDKNIGFGAAVNAGFRASSAPYLATLNDDACPEPQWLGALTAAMETRDDIGMCASRIRLAGRDKLDSAGMLLCGDGSSKQRGHLAYADSLTQMEEVLLPSACAALYRRNMLEEVGLFDEGFFLYCEDTDLGLRARRSGWKCLYAPDAVVDHRYSHSAGRASPLKAYLVERNRLRLVLKNFPALMLWRAPFIALARYFWHVASIVRGEGAASEFGRDGHSPLLLMFYVLRAHIALLFQLPKLVAARRAIHRRSKISAAEFRGLLDRYSISAREVASL